MRSVFGVAGKIVPGELEPLRDRFVQGLPLQNQVDAGQGY